MNQMIAVRPCEGEVITLVDDHIEALSGVVRLLVSDGFEVREYDAIADAETDENLSCAFWVIDKRFGSRSDGLRLFKRLQKLPNKRIIMLTGYPAASDRVGEVRYNEQLNNLSLVISKPDSFAFEYENVAVLLEEVFRSQCLPATLDLKPLNEKTEYQHYSELSEDEQDDIFENAMLRHEQIIEDAWERGAIWLCIYGMLAEDVDVVFDADDIPNSAEVDAKCERLGLPAFVVDRSMSFHNFGCSASAEQGGANIASYPHVKLEVPGHAPSGFHFDSGADTSLFDSNYVRQCETGSVRYLTANKRPERKLIQSKPHLVRLIEVEGLLKFQRYPLGDPDEDAKLRSKGVKVTGLSVRDWQNCDLVAHCSTKCGNGDKGTMCLFRKHGLIGRDFYIDNELSLVLMPDHTDAKVIY